jgi:hypothetical protein
VQSKVTVRAAPMIYPEKCERQVHRGWFVGWWSTRLALELIAEVGNLLAALGLGGIGVKGG